jgi:hypothetical protein
MVSNRTPYPSPHTVYVYIGTYYLVYLFTQGRGGRVEPERRFEGLHPIFPNALCASKSTYLATIFYPFLPITTLNPAEVLILLFLNPLSHFSFLSPFSSFFLAFFCIFFYFRHLLSFFRIFLFSDLSIFQPTVLLLLHLSILLLYFSPPRLFFLLSLSTFIPFLPHFLYHLLFLYIFPLIFLLQFVLFILYLFKISSLLLPHPTFPPSFFFSAPPFSTSSHSVLLSSSSSSCNFKM